MDVVVIVIGTSISVVYYDVSREFSSLMYGINVITELNQLSTLVIEHVFEESNSSRIPPWDVWNKLATNFDGSSVFYLKRVIFIIFSTLRCTGRLI